ncbi:hypothetical protein SISNIDRAFT_471237, partial [Sistotremastrum niveocremeum HHB9708]
LSVDEAARIFGIAELRPALGDYFCQPKIQNQHVIGGRLRSSVDCQLPFSHIRIWYRMRIQIRDQFGTVLPSEDCQASPPSQEQKRGHYDTVIAINNAGDSLTDAPGDPLDIGNHVRAFERHIWPTWSALMLYRKCSQTEDYFASRIKYRACSSSSEQSVATVLVWVGSSTSRSSADRPS